MKRSVGLLLLCIGLMIVAAIGPVEWFLWNRTPAHWADDTVKQLEKMGVPMPWERDQWDETVGRGEFCVLCVSIFSPAAGEEEQLFSDVPPDHPAYSSINAACRSGWVAKAEVFRPDDPLTREELLRICANLIPLEQDQPLQNAASDVSQELQPLVSAAVQSELFYLYEGEEFRPNEPVTKAGAAAVLCRILTSQKNGDAVRRAMLLEYLHGFERGEDLSPFCTGQEAEQQSFRRDTVLPFFQEKGIQKSIKDLTLTLSPQGAQASYTISYGERKVKAQTRFTTQQEEQGWLVSDAQTRLMTQQPVRLVWEYASRPDMEYTNKNAANIVSPTWFKLIDEQETEVMPKDSLITEGLYLTDYYSAPFAKEAKKREQQIWGLCSNGFSPDRTRQVLSDDALRAALIQTIFSKATEYGLEGINLDFENMYQEDRDLFTQFVRECYLYARECGVILSVDVTKIEETSHFYSMCYHRGDLSRYADYMMLMAYDQHPRSSQVPGPIAALDWTEEGLTGVLEEVPADRLILGVPFYTRIWETKEGQVTDAPAASMEEVQALVEEKNLTPLWSDTEQLHYVEYAQEDALYKIWIEDQDSMAARIELIRQYSLAGIAGWSGGYETPQIWELIGDRLK
ncbi:MAG: glycosyl hydrolase family 18 protein [Clostridia bacterium]|nr:glycosyl hydrolase family 18 protein [Clostridia bacterium]